MTGEVDLPKKVVYLCNETDFKNDEIFSCFTPISLTEAENLKVGSVIWERQSACSKGVVFGFVERTVQAIEKDEWPIIIFHDGPTHLFKIEGLLKSRFAYVLVDEKTLLDILRCNTLVQISEN